jgi:hypothetical protein
MSLALIIGVTHFRGSQPLIKINEILIWLPTQINIISMSNKSKLSLWGYFECLLNIIDSIGVVA